MVVPISSVALRRVVTLGWVAALGWMVVLRRAVVLGWAVTGRRGGNRDRRGLIVGRRGIRGRGARTSTATWRSVAAILFEDAVLRAVGETPLPKIVGGVVLVVEHVVTLSLEPTQRLLSALVAFGRIAGAPLGNLWLLDGRIRGRASDLAPETVHVHLGGTAVYGMNPMPGTDTATVGARRHILRNLEVGIDRPNALVVDAENGQILGLDAVHVRSIRN